ncbi:hypothetical protein K438DRAFT_1774190 [Mycena galopus ATCC 62051]|nr:hypothetical protein K438DRAFT_1774190 [Mycena galopus ATCC 62051]
MTRCGAGFQLGKPAIGGFVRHRMRVVLLVAREIDSRDSRVGGKKRTRKKITKTRGRGRRQGSTITLGIDVASHAIPFGVPFCSGCAIAHSPNSEACIEGRDHGRRAQGGNGNREPARAPRKQRARAEGTAQRVWRRIAGTEPRTGKEPGAQEREQLDTSGRSIRGWQPQPRSKTKALRFDVTWQTGFDDRVSGTEGEPGSAEITRRTAHTNQKSGSASSSGEDKVKMHLKATAKQPPVAEKGDFIVPNIARPVAALLSLPDDETDCARSGRDERGERVEVGENPKCHATKMPLVNNVKWIECTLPDRKKSNQCRKKKVSGAREVKLEGRGGNWRKEYTAGLSGGFDLHFRLRGGGV